MSATDPTYHLTCEFCPARGIEAELRAERDEAIAERDAAVAEREEALATARELLSPDLMRDLRRSLETAQALNDLRAERDEAIAEATRLREREAHFVKVLGVADGGEYRNDWDSRIAAVVAERDRLTREVERLRAVMAKLPHERHCEAGAPLFPGRCSCWKSREALREPEPEAHGT